MIEDLSPQTMVDAPKRPGRDRTYLTWAAMKNRCKNATHRSYPHYGGRGIKVCARWAGSDGLKYFIADMGRRPPGMTLDRIDVNGDYCPENCRWATAKTQRRNRRNAPRPRAFGKAQTYAEWAEEYGTSMKVIRLRVQRYGWTLEEALTHDTVRAPKGSGRTFLRVPRASQSIEP
jgi:hypothetical protein